MTKRRKKSSGWRPADKRCSWEETRKLGLAEQDARFTAESNRLGLWRSCPAAACRRKRACAVDPYRCTKERGANPAAGGATPAPRPNQAPQAATAAAKEAPRFAISAKEAAAIIKADVEAHLAATGGDPDGIMRGGF